MLQTVCMSPELLVNQNMSESESCGYSPGQGSPLPGETASPKSCFQQSPSLPDSGLTELNVASPTLYRPPPACTPQGMPAPADSELSPDPPGKRYMGVRVKMPVRELLRKIRLSKGLDPAHGKEASPVKMVTKGSSGKTEKRRAHPYTEKQLRQSKQSAGQSPKGLEDLDILVEVLQEDLNRSQLREEPLPAAPHGFWQGFPRWEAGGSREDPRGGQQRSAEPCPGDFHPILRGLAEPSPRAGSQGCGSPGMLSRTGGWWVPSSRKDFRRNCPSQGGPAQLSPAEPLPAAPGGSAHTEGRLEPSPVPFPSSGHTEGQPEPVPVPFPSSPHTEGQPEHAPVPFPSSGHTETRLELSPVRFPGSAHTEGHPQPVPVPFPSSRHTEGQLKLSPVPFPSSAYTEGQREPVPVPFRSSTHTEGHPQPVPVPFPISAHTEGQSQPVLVPFPGSAHTETRLEPSPVPFPSSGHTKGQPVPVPVPFPQHDLSALSFFQFQLRREESALSNIPAEKLLAPDGNGNRLLHKAVAQGRRALTFALAQRFASLNKIDEKDAEKRTALHLAAEKNQHLMVSDLISLGANVNEQDSSGKTPLHLCAENGYLRVLEVLKNCKNNGVRVEVDLPDHYGLTPLHRAALAHTVLVTESQRIAPDTDLGRFLRLRREQILEGILCLLQMGGRPELQVRNSCQTSSAWLRLEENTELMCLLQNLKTPGWDVLHESSSLLDTPRGIPAPPAAQNSPQLCPTATPDLFDVLLKGKC